MVWALVNVELNCVRAGCFENGDDDDDDDDDNGVCGGSAGFVRECGVNDEPPVTVGVDVDTPAGFNGENADAFAAVGVGACSTRW